MLDTGTDLALRQAAEVIRRLKRKVQLLESRLQDNETSQAEPIAVVGVGCRLPGADSPDELWRLLDAGEDPVTSVTVGGEAIACGAIRSLDEFDADFFGVPAEAARRMDTRQRMVLEVGWEALEQAGIPPTSIDGSEVGVFLGALGDGACRFPSDPSPLDVPGTLASFIATRLSHFLGIRGPSLTVDTACSSSLVAIHQASRSLRARECTLALAGGVYTYDRDGRFARSATGEFSLPEPDVRCRSFDASAAGLVGSDGCVILVLQGLADAVANGNAIWGVLAGSAVNHSGRSQSLIAPSAIAQAEVVRKALAEAHVQPDEVDYVECHGTGSKVGDSIEANALGDVFGPSHRRARPVVLGALKSNLGYTGAAAGAAGLLKVLLALRYERIPRNLHFEHANPHVPWGKLAIAPASQASDWQRTDKPRVAGVSAYGISGVNAHVVVREPPLKPADVYPKLSERARIFLLSAKVPAALQRAAGRLAAHLERRPEHELADVEYTLAVCRAHHTHRAAIRAGTREQLVAALSAIAAGRQPETVALGVAGSAPPALAWVVPSQPPLPTVVRGLSAEYPAFAAALVQVATALGVPSSMAAADALAALETQSGARSGVAGLAVVMGLAALWRDWGCEARSVSGQGPLGELMAGVLGGTLALADAAATLERALDSSTPAAEASGLRSVMPGAGLDNPSASPAVHWLAGETRWTGAPRQTEHGLVAVELAGDASSERSIHEALLVGVGRLYVAGVRARFERVFPRRRVPLALPTYSWQHQRF
jgi:acyl transferase domain-containing protein